MQSSVHLVGEAQQLEDKRVCMPRTHMGSMRFRCCLPNGKLKSPRRLNYRVEIASLLEMTEKRVDHKGNR